MTGIAEMFAELSDYDAYEHQIVAYCLHRRAARAEQNRLAVAAWRARHPEMNLASTRKWRAKKPAHQCSQCKEPRVPGRKVCQSHLESDRAKSKARYAARKAAA